MELNKDHTQIAEKVRQGMKFGLFEDGQKCYFEDGTKVDYSILWKALHEVYPIEATRNKTIYQVCPDTFIGIFPHKFSKRIWKKK